MAERSKALDPLIKLGTGSEGSSPGIGISFFNIHNSVFLLHLQNRILNKTENIQSIKSEQFFTIQGILSNQSCSNLVIS